MAKDMDEISKGTGGARKQSGSAKRAKHRKISAASAKRKREAGMIRLSLWVPNSCADDVRRFANSLQVSASNDQMEDVRAAAPEIVAGFVPPPRPQWKPKTRHGDDRQLDLFGSQEPVRVR